MSDIKKIKKTLAKLEKEFDRAEGQPLKQARILKKANVLERKIKQLEGE
jgi:hypothetical protein